MFHCVVRDPISRFPHQVILIAPHSFPIALLMVSNFPIAWRAKGPKLSIAPSRAPNFLIMSSKWWLLIFHHISEVPIHHWIIKAPPHCDLYDFPSRYQGVPIYHCVINGPPISSSCHQNDDFWFSITLSRGPNSSLHHQGAPLWPLWFPITLSRGPNLSLRHQFATICPSRHQGIQISKIHHEICTD